MYVVLQCIYVCVYNYACVHVCMPFSEVWQTICKILSLIFFLSRSIWLCGTKRICFPCIYTCMWPCQPCLLHFCVTGFLLVKWNRDHQKVFNLRCQKSLQYMVHYFCSTYKCSACSLWHFSCFFTGVWIWSSFRLLAINCRSSNSALCSYQQWWVKQKNKFSLVGWPVLRFCQLSCNILC